MIPYIKNQLIKLCNHLEWFNDMLISLDNNPEEPHTAIRNYLSHVQLNGLLENTEIVHVSFNGDEPKPGFYFEIPKDPNMYLILGILDEDERPRTVPLANFLNEDQGYESGISMYGHYIACKCLDISSEKEYMNQLTDIRILTNELEPC